MSYAKLKASGRRERREALLRAANATGEQRALAEKNLKSIGIGSFAYSVRYMSAALDFDGTGRIVEAGKQKTKTESVEDGSSSAEPHARNILITEGSLAGSAPGNKRYGNLIIPCGVCLLIGGGGVGKTPLAHELAGFGVEEYGVVRVGEPLAGYTASEYAAATELGMSVAESSDVVLDSIKDVLSGGGGGLMKSGLSRAALNMISAWSMLACDLGVTIYIPVNPSTKDEEVKELLAEAARSNATMAIIHNQGDDWEYFARMGEGLNRKHGTFTMRWKNDEPHLSFSGHSVEEVSERSAALSISSRVRDWDAIVRRSMTPIDNE